MLWRIRTEVDEKPGRLAAVAGALATSGANILDLTVAVDVSGTVDEFVVDAPRGIGVAELVAVLDSAGGRRTVAISASPHELTDEPTRALLLAARLHADPRTLPDALAKLLRADSASWVYGDEAEEPSAATTLVVPVGPRRAVRVDRVGLPYTLTEAARAEALVRFLLPVGPAESATYPVVLPSGARVMLRIAGPGDHAEVAALHERCGPLTRRARYLGAAPVISDPLWRRMTDPARGVTVVARDLAGAAVAIGQVMYAGEPGVAELAMLIEDDWQGHGLGTALAGRLIGLARDRGLAELRATLLGDNQRMRRILQRFGATLRPAGGGVCEARLPVAAAAPVG